MKYYHESTDEEILEYGENWWKVFKQPPWCMSSIAILPMPPNALGGCLKLLRKEVVNRESCLGCNSLREV